MGEWNILFTREKLSKAKLILKENKGKANVVVSEMRRLTLSTVLPQVLTQRILVFKERTLKTSQKPLMIRKQDMFMTVHKDMNVSDILRKPGGGRVLLHDLIGLPLPVQMQAV